MALIDKASLLMVPSTYEAGKLYNVLPSGNRAPDSTDQNSGYDQTRADFDFDRGSNTAATRVNADGLIEKYRENLLLQSNQFDTTWAVNTASVTSGQIGYDGSSDAWLLNKAGANKFLYQTTTFVGVQTISIYAKAGSLNWLYINCGGGVYGGYFDLSNGVTGSNIGTAISTKIEAVDNTGWYRCEVSGTYNGSTSFRVYPADGNNDTSGTSGNILIQSAQLETGLVATDYLESTSVTGKAGVLIDLPRIDYSSGAGALLLEPSRSNIVSQSEYFGGWNLSRTSAFGSGSILNDITSPEGVVNAAYIQQASGETDGGGVYNGYSYTSGTTYTLSVFAKKGENRYARIGFGIGGGGAGIFCGFDLQEGIAGTPNTGITPSIEPFADGWYRCSITATAQFTGARNTFVYQSSNLNDFVTTPLQGIYIYGAQLEVGSYATSYIPTMGTTQTRAADSCSVTGVSDVIGQTEGTLFWEVQIDTPVATANESLFNIDAGGFGNTIYLIKGATGNIVGEMYVSSAAQASFTLTGISAGNYKIAFAYAQNNTAMFVNGVQVGATDTSCNVPATSRIQLGNGVFGPSTDKTKQVALFNERLSNAELAALTA